MRHSDSNRNYIIKAATDSFYEKGYADSTLKEICASCGLSHVAIYRHFDNKGKLGELIIKRYYKCLIHLTRQYSESADAAHTLLYYWGIHFRFITLDKKFSAFFYEFSDNEHQQFFQLVSSYFFSVFADMFDYHKDELYIKIDLENISMVVSNLENYCSKKLLNEKEALKYTVKLVDMLNKNKYKFTDEMIDDFYKNNMPENMLKEYRLKEDILMSFFGTPYDD